MGAPDNPPAFPMCNESGDVQFGMTLRDWFAGHVLAGLMTNGNMPFAPDYAECEPSQIASASFEIADAMLVARGEQP